MMTPDRWRQIENLYHAARDCPPKERAALLDCTDPDIRLRVERMLELESGNLMLDRPAEVAADATQTVPDPGAQLGPYQIQAQIGAGGMGVVYRAIDTRLGRVVAIKITAERYSERFQLEARAISTLNHPNVCTLYDVGPNYLVMEFLEGSTLAAEIGKGPLAPETVARYGAQIAEALAEAHSLGIVHRDLKPSNIMLTRHGVKVLDFGLAKMIREIGHTETGGVMGTPAYMAPEQVEGKEPGSAADLFSLGLVLYEMSVGRLPFPGASLGQMLSSGSQAALPAPSRERLGVPSGLDTLIAKLLEKDPSKRPSSASQVARELSALADRPAVAPPKSRLRPIYAIPALVLLLLLPAFLYLRSKSPQPQSPIPNNPAAYVQLTSFTDAATWPTLSPDGRMLAFYRSNNPFLTPDEIWVKLLPDGEPVQVTHGPRGKYNIAFSPDGSHIAYTSFNPNLFQTYIVSSLGGDSQLLFPNAAGLSWLSDGQILFSQIKTGVHMGIVTSKIDQSDLREIYFPLLERGMAHYSYLSPDKKWVLLAEMNPQWQPCRAVPFTGGSLGRQVGPPGACTSAAWSPDGQWIYMGVQVTGRRHIWRQRFPNGQPEQVTFGSTEEDGIAMAPDGRSLITSIFTQQNVVWIHDSHGDRALSSEGYASPTPPVFSADGKRLYYLLHRDSPESPAELQRADVASGKSEVVIPGVSMSDYDISLDEKDVVYSTQPPGRPSQLWIAPMDHTLPPRSIGSGGEATPHFGPNDDVIFRFTEDNAYYIGAMKRDGTGRRKALPGPILNINSISPDRRVVIAAAVRPGSPNRAAPGTNAFPLDGGPPRRICECATEPAWSANSRYFYMPFAPASRANPGGKTAAIPLPPGESLPLLFPDWSKIPGVKIIDHDNIAPGPNPSIYAYIKPSVHANLYRIPLN